LSGFSSIPCEKAILYQDANYTTVNTEILAGTGCTTPLTNTTVKSVEIKGGCNLNLYADEDCPTPPDIILGSSIVLEGSIYGITEFKSVRIEGK
jgi:hypothetical protein